MARDSFVTHLACGLTGEQFASDVLQRVSSAGKPLLVRYDLAAIAQAVRREQLTQREPSIWRYRELLPLPLDQAPISLGELMTPLLSLPAETADLKLGQVLVKDESRLPTGSFKARGLVMAVNMAALFGVRAMAIPTNGNAGAAMAAYCARAGIAVHCFCPSDTPTANLREIALHGATLHRVDGMIDDCGKLVAAGEREGKWFSCATLREPYRIEGKKTMGLELAEQLGWQLPDAIFYPTGGGTGLIGMWKAFAELAALGWIAGKMPRMYAIQAAGCAPIVRAFDQNERFATRWEQAETVAHGIRVPAALGDFLILDAVRESGGAALAVSEQEIRTAWQDSAKRDGVLMCPEGAATLAGLRIAHTRGLVAPGERVVLFNCASAYKYDLPDIYSAT
ncbi:threonine synthase [Ahniella affigens]|uniref:Threonine synthase n=1 Tax=Ahniella affigens TaxID=2021234 RepID=A0A2P1PRH9_9GAMM|nr:threonine synthase [Ahniella affigens]AVP97456.1 threonine synthase [Ahniella affigens]